MRIWLPVLLCVPLSAAAQDAQPRPPRSDAIDVWGVDKTAIVQGFAVSVTPAEFDGDPESREWLVRRIDSAYHYAALEVDKGGRVCLGPWFNPIPSYPPGSGVGLGGFWGAFVPPTGNGRSMFIFQNERHYLEVRPKPACDLPWRQW